MGTPTSGMEQVTLNGSPVSYNSTTKIWEATGVSLSQGVNVFTARAVDNAGNESTTLVTIIRDLTQPSVTITSPSNGTIILDASIPLAGHSSDGGSDSSGISRVTVNGTDATLDLISGNWNLTALPLAVGTNTITATTFDRAGNQASSQITVTRVVNQAPAVNAGSDQAIELPDPANLNGTATDDGYPFGSGISVSWSKIGGNGNVTFSNPGSLQTTAEFSAQGTYVLRLSATDGQFSSSDDVTITVYPVNEVPVVNAGNSQTIELPNSLNLVGTATDDGFPINSSLSFGWSKVSGLGDVTFSNSASLTTSAQFTAAGVYVLRLTVSDGQLSTSADVTITVNPPNGAPVVNAGNDQAIMLPFSATLTGTATDDGNPPGSTLSISWSKVSGTGQVAFSNSHAPSTLASFSDPGTYTLRLSATDGSLTTSDDLTIVVSPANLAPVVDAGSDQSASLPNPVSMNGTVTDDGVPENGSLTTVWTKISGPGDVSFSNPASLSAAASFSQAGTYILQLSATDGNLVSSDDVTVNIGPANHAPIVNAGEDKIVALPTGTFQFVQNNLAQFNQVAATPPVVVDFDNIPAGTNITGNSYNGVSFDLGNQPSPSAPLIVVKGTDTFTPGGFSGVFNASTNKLIATSGENVLSPGGIELAPGTNDLKENDDLKLTFDEPVAAVGLDILFQEYDGFSAVGITIRDPQGTILYQNSNLPVSSNAGGGAPGGKEFFGFISRRSNIKTIVIDDFDNNNVNPDCNIGFDTIRVQKVIPNTSVVLNGSVTDDGLPVGGNLTSAWTKVSGPGTVTFANDASPTTAVTFNQTGTYVLRLTGSDSELSASDDVTINAVVDGQQPANQAPQVNAGSDQTITLADPAHLFAIVTDDGLPAGSITTTTWSKISGPGTVTFSLPNSYGTDASFSQTGAYVLRLTASDTVLTTTDDLTVTVLDSAAVNQPPTADAGSDRSVTLNGNLVGNPSGEADLIGNQIPQWTIVSGSGTRVEGEVNNAPPARFGNYVISGGNAAQNELRQDVDIRAYAEGINAGTQAFEWKAYIRSLSETVPDPGRIVLEYRDASNQFLIATLSSGDIASTTDWHFTEDVRVPPAGTGFIRIRLFATRNTGTMADVFFDGLSLRAVGGGAAVKLNGVSTDDGLPSGSVLRSAWAKVSGAGNVIFGNQNAADSSAKFDTAGTYILRLTATDGAFSASDETTVTVSPANQAPVANAGSDQTITLPATAQLSGTASDDGSSLHHRWTKVSGPGLVTFSDSKTTNPTVTCSLAGTYLLRFVAEDGDLESIDDVKITVNPAPFNQPPTVDAGNGQTIQLPTNSVSLTGAVADDGLPNNNPTITWTKRLGPGNVTFANASTPGTIATFDAAGSYILRLTATDGQYAAWDEISIVVNPESGGGGGQNQPPVVVVGPDQTIGISQSAILEAQSITDDGLPTGGSYTANWSTVSGPGNVTFSNPNETATYATFSQLGTYVLSLAVSDSELSGNDDITVIVNPDQPAPVIEILTPGDGVNITEPTTITGNISGGSWVLEYSLADTDDPTHRVWTPISSGSGSASGNLGTIDTTLMLNGLYDVRLTATNQSGQFTTTTMTVAVTNNLKVGNFSVSFEDMNVPVAGIPIQVVRTYDSRDKRRGDFGIGWTLGIKNVRVEKNETLGLKWYQTVSNTFIPNYCIEPLRSHIVTVTMPDGKVQKFEAKLDVQCQRAAPITGAHLIFAPQPGTQGTLSVNGDNSVFVAGSVPGPVDLVAFDSSGIFDRTTFIYTAKDGTKFTLAQGVGLQSLADTNGNTVTVSASGITHSSGKSISFIRDNLGRITQITDPNGVSNFYTYDDNGDLISYKDREENTTSFTYEPTIPHHLKSIVDPLNRTPIRNEYDASGRLLKHIDADGNEIVYTHDLAARVEIVRDRLDHETRYEYDSRGNVLKKRDALGTEMTFTYDGDDNVLTETNALGKTTTYTYDAFDNRTSITDPLNNKTIFTYSSQGKVLTVKDARNNVTTNTYDTAGNLLTTKDALNNVTTNTYGIFDGQLRSTTDALTHSTGYEYFSGYLKTITDAQGNETTFAYDSNGNRSSQTVKRTNAQGQIETITTSFEYDNTNRLTKTIFADGTFTEFEYNALGQQKAPIDQGGNRTEFEYDDLGRLIKTTYADVKFEESTYDLEGRRLTYKDRAGHVTNYEYDALGRLKKTTYSDGTFTTTTYDAAGQVLSSTDARGNTTTYTYDYAGRRLTVKNALNQITEFTYDENGNQLTIKDALDHTTGYVYDELNRRTRTNFADSSFTETAYDELGRRIAEKDQAGKITQFVYDSLGRLTKVKDALNQETIYAYNEVGRYLCQILGPAEGVSTFQVLKNFRLITVLGRI
jgi:YD repeat-containing protein